MITNLLNDGNGLGCELNAAGDGVLLQLCDAADGEQVRVRLDIVEANDLAYELIGFASLLRQRKSALQSPGAVAK